ncbi:MAG: hypothetical protein GY714_32420 [Desulfobacterales bacterium]|nr:hypothetical protein [Desulfobacterales bacterium]
MAVFKREIHLEEHLMISRINLKEVQSSIEFLWGMSWKQCIYEIAHPENDESFLYQKLQSIFFDIPDPRLWNRKWSRRDVYHHGVLKIKKQVQDSEKMTVPSFKVSASST